MRIGRTDNTVLIQAPAKLNLFLEILSRRDDGFHELETLMVAITIYDTVVVSPDPTGGIRLRCGWSPGREAGRIAGVPDQDAVWEAIPDGSRNLASGALDRLRVDAGLEMGARALLHKRIPSAAGLGGASSDAAAALVAAATAWNVGPDSRAVRAAAEQTGSDVAFFHRGLVQGAAAAVCRGRGERVETLESAPRFHFVVVRPPAGLSTAEVYRHVRVPEAPRDVASARRSFESGDPNRLGRALHNRLREPAERLSPWVSRMRRLFAELDLPGHELSGSGTSYFGVCRNARHARRTATRLNAVIGGAAFAASTHFPIPTPLARSESMQSFPPGDRSGGFAVS
ncbi:MAG: 4-(cytidine 5'-diphospho)-2-C-methyl-D-erythritol kinase [Planctomycetes bacterium]|nr:4-(cytidine 5'-diphospho)-2-C-methyl-D-erythritol kinase [Planctomycetota bacterium]